MSLLSWRDRNELSMLRKLTGDPADPEQIQRSDRFRYLEDFRSTVCENHVGIRASFAWIGAMVMFCGNERHRTADKLRCVS